jgi:uncharacterized membrane protein
MTKKNNAANAGAARRIGAAVVFAWFVIGGIAHFVSPEPFLKIIPPGLPWREHAVAISGFFELLGAVGLLLRGTRRAAGIGLFLLTVAVTPANIYMWQHLELFPEIPGIALLLRLPLQLVLLWVIWKVFISSPGR